MEITNEVQTPVTTAVEPEYEWGVQYRSSWSAEFQAQWGYSEDPRISGVIDEEGDIEIESYYHKAVAVGKRIKAPQVWEEI